MMCIISDVFPPLIYPHPGFNDRYLAKVDFPSPPLGPYTQMILRSSGTPSMC
ncbi:C2 [Banana bunchy top alphasatellite 1]|uniref:C2 n=1 Tax=Banana bunchy top alphasatellite 1 TaxID=2169721 RepID=Q83032_9VIRU|nr:C2 [Banana bunchy top alphasatellite 1]AAA51428.1 C2 [Banana bunchy top alphasatellite 1]prf//2122372G ORF C2 [Banana bunchy top virus]